MKRGLKFGIIAISVLVVLGITSCPNNHDFERVNMIIINNSTVHTITALLHGKTIGTYGSIGVNLLQPGRGYS